MAGSETIGFRADEGLESEIDEFRDRYGYENRSEAVKALVETGLREAKSPILTRWRESALQGAWYIVLTAICFTVLAASPGVLELGIGLQIAAVLLAIAAALVAAIELARVARGSSELSGMAGGWF